MYLISVEGGDGSGKGEAARLLLELAAEFRSLKSMPHTSQEDTVNLVSWHLHL